MFTIDKYFSSLSRPCVLDITVRDEVFRVRRLDGLDLLELSELPDTTRKVIHVLASCLLDGETDKPIGHENAVRFIKEHLLLATDIATRILDMTSELGLTERKIKREARQNF